MPCRLQNRRTDPPAKDDGRDCGEDEGTEAPVHLGEVGHVLLFARRRIGLLGIADLDVGVDVGGVVLGEGLAGGRAGLLAVDALRVVDGLVRRVAHRDWVG